jgi:ribokinase
LKKVFVLGSANTDLTIKAERLPRAHETVGDGEFRMSHGGKGANQALAALKAGADVELFAKIGTDVFGTLLYDHLIDSNLPEDGLLRDPDMAAGIALITIDNAGNNQIAVAPGSNMRFSVEDFNSLTHRVHEGALLLTQFEIPLRTVEHALRFAKTRGITTIVDPSPVRPLPPSLYQKIDLLTPNEQEAGELAGVAVATIDRAVEAASILSSRGCRAVIVTMGVQGALLKHGKTVEHVPSFAVNAIDSVAAGDAFNGALAAALANGISLGEAVLIANAAGALCTTRRGAQESLPTKTEVEAVLRQA